MEVSKVQLADGRQELLFAVPNAYLCVEEYVDTPGRLPYLVTVALKRWMAQPVHWLFPYPSEDEKAHLSATFAMTQLQLCNWFRNERKRIWLPLRRRAELLWQRSNHVLPTGPVATAGPPPPTAEMTVVEGPIGRDDARDPEAASSHSPPLHIRAVSVIPNEVQEILASAPSRVDESLLEIRLAPLPALPSTTVFTHTTPSH
jgi:hypothetical protein